MSTKNILVVRLGGIGDVVIITPSLKALRKIYPQSRISLMTNHYSAEIVQGSPWVDEVITFTDLFSSQKLSDFIKPKILKQFYELINLMLKRRFDIYICFHSLIQWSALIKPLFLAILSRATLRVGFDTFNRGFFFNIKTKDGHDKHLMYRCLDAVRQLSVRTGNTTILVDEKYNILPEIWLHNEDLQYAEDFFTKNIKPNDFIIGIHPGGNPRYSSSKCWHLERYVQLINSIQDKYGARILLTGGKTDQPILDRIIPLLKETPLLLPDVSIKQLSAIIKRCNIFISNDTGPMHLAVAMKVQTIGIFGGGEYQMYGTYPPKSGFIGIKKDISCYPCYHKIKSCNHKCLDEITIEEVLQAVETQIKRLKINPLRNTVK
ncbi:MAG: glycosyltransferase family 9 protein [Planctomycetota bacterium]